jgi:hypothetical protein
VQTGVIIAPETRTPKDMRGVTMPVEFAIVDRLAISANETAGGSPSVELKPPNAPYAVKVLLSV